MTNLETLLLAMLGNKGGGGEGGTTNYNELDNRPQVNGITLTGNKDSEDLNLVDVNMIGVSYGVAALDGEGKVPESQLPPYPDYDTEIQNINEALEGKAEQGSVSTLEEKVEKKQNKTFIDSVDSETHVVTVPDDVAGFAAISKISGKTVKKNFATPITGLEEKTVSGIKFTPVFDSNGALLYVNALGITSDKKTTSATGAAYTVSKITSSVQGYIISAGLNGKSISGTKCVVELAESPWSSICVSEGSGDRAISTTMISGKTYNFYIQVLPDTVVDNIKFYPMIRPSDTDATYQPSNTLWNAPVKSVVSCGRNIFDKKVITTNGSFNISDGTIVTDTVNKTRLCGYVLIPTGISTIVMTGDTSWSGAYGHVFFDADKKFISTIGVATSDTKKVNVPSNARYIGISIFGQAPYDSRDTLQIEVGSTATSYTPYNKTTVSIPQEILDLPDYGCSAGKVYNWVDFENMVYHHNVGSEDLGNKSWSPNTTGDTLMYGNPPANSMPGNVNATYPLGDIVDEIPTKTWDLRVYEKVYKKMYIRADKTYTSEELKNRLKGVIINYELATPEVIDISSILYPFKVKSGGTITFENEYNLDVNNTVLYKKEVL